MTLDDYKQQAARARAIHDDAEPRRARFARHAQAGAAVIAIPAHLSAASSWIDQRGVAGELGDLTGEALTDRCRAVADEAGRLGVDGVYAEDLEALVAWWQESVE